MTIVEMTICDNVAQIELNRRSLAELRSGMRTGVDRKDDTTETIKRLEDANIALQEANLILSIVIHNALRRQPDHCSA